MKIINRYVCNHSHILYVVLVIQFKLMILITNFIFDLMQVHDANWTSSIVIYGLLEYFLVSGTMCEINPFLLLELEFLQFYF
jgi:hypothetical protein